MRSTPRLRREMKALIGAFGVALALSYAWVLPRIVLDAEDRIFGQQLERLRTEWARQGYAAGALSAPGARAIVDLRAESPELAALLAELAPGVHEFNDDPLPGLSGTELLIAVEAATERHPKRWLLYDVTGMEALEGPWRPEYLLAVGGGLLLALAATVVGLLAGRRVFVALEDLERLLSSGPPPPGTRSAAERRDDEVGRIARVWRETDGRLRAALDREQRFTRDASHELRTPIATARGAVELLRAEPDASPERREELLRRVDTALLEMGDLVGAFLWLAREPEPEREGLDREEFSLTALVERILAERATILRPDARVHWERRGEGRVEGSERLATVVLGNLLGNALVHGTGELWVSVEDACFTVRNSVKPSRAAREAQSFGFGRAICSDLCARFGWRLESWQREDDFFVRVEFRRDSESAAPRS